MRPFLLAFCLGAFVSVGAGARAREAEGIAATAASFDIAAQPLAAALDAYSAATGMQVIYDGALASGRRSTAVKGAMAPDTALQLLLNGTGLVVVYSASKVFTVLPKPAVPAARAATIDDYMPYLAAVQSSVAEAFCRHPLTAPGDYRIKFRFWIAPTGKVSRSQLLGSTNDDRRDQAIVRLLDGLTIDRPPPSAMPQPVVMAIFPRSPAETGDCGAGNSLLQRAAAP
jgi:hypothetical protein